MRDIVFAGLVLVVFALFHHVIPRPGLAIGNVTVITTPAAQSGVASSGVPDVVVTDVAQLTEETVAPVYAPGDFTAAFPAGDTGTGALRSYQSDELKIAVSMVQENDITYYVADVWVRNISAFTTAFAKGQYGTGIHQDPVKMASANNAILAITGDYYGARNKGVVVRNGELYRDSLNGDVCVLYSDGVMETYREA